MNDRQFQPGFRLSAIDVFVLVIGTFGSILIGSLMPPLGIAIAFVVCHFFLFCNVIRMDRPLELAWAALFVILGGSTILTNRPGWPATFGVSLITTVILIVLQTLKPSYHGLLWQRINPRLPEWWHEQQELDTR